MTTPLSPEEELAQPGTSAARLSEIATARIDLAAVIARHPNAHDALLDWIAAYGDDGAKRAVAERRAQQAPAGDQPAPPADAPQTPQAPTEAPEPFRAAPLAAPVVPAQAQQPPYGQAPHEQAQQPPYAQGGPAAVGPQPPAYATAAGGRDSAQPQPYPGQPAAGGYAPQAGAAPKKSRKGLWITAGAIGVVAVLAGGGAIWAAQAGLFGGGSKTPEAAAAKLVDGIVDVDPVALYTSLAPSEIGSLRDAFDTLEGLGHGDDDDYLPAIQGAIDSFEITSSDLEYETDELMDEISRVRLVGGTMTFDADPAALEEAARVFVEQQYSSDYYTEYYSEEELEQMTDDSVSGIVDDITADLPYTIDFAEEWAGAAENYYVDPNDEEALARAYPYSVITVDEDGGWFVSALLTGTERATAGSSEAYGTEMIEGTPFSSPEEALQGLTDGITEYAEGGDYTAVAEALPLAERRWASLFGPAIGLADSGGGMDIAFSGLDATSDVDGDRAAIDVRNLDIEANGSVVTYSHPCISTTDYSGAEQEYCLDDVPQLELLGLDEARPIAVKEDGGWYVGPVATLANAAEIMTENYQKLVDEGREDELFDTDGGDF